MSTNTIFNIKITLGDWDNENDGMHKSYCFTSFHPIQSIREAFFFAKEKYPKLCPENFCKYNKYLSKEEFELLRDEGAPLDIFSYSISNKELYYKLEGDEMIELIIWFLRKGNPNLTLFPMHFESLHFHENEERCIHPFGHGLF